MLQRHVGSSRAMATERPESGAAEVHVAACSSSKSGADSPTLYNNWIYSNANGTGGVGLTLKSDNTYAQIFIALTSATSADTEIETGTFTTAGSKITFTPQKWSCEEPT